MHEQSKLEEARYFYSQMVKEINDREAFVFNLSAFLSAARSVLQYALKEVKSKEGGQQWYQGHMEANPVSGFFKGKRNVGVHEKPISPRQHTSVTVTTTINFSGSASYTHLDANGNVVYQSPPEKSKPRPKSPDAPPITTTRFEFADWEGNEDVLMLSRMYLDELQRVVVDGRRKGYLTR